MAEVERVALVTGGAKGIGRAIAEDLAQDHGVAVTWLSTAPEGLPEPVLALQADLTEADAAERVVQAVIDRFGRIDVIVNNAGQVASTPADGFDRAAAMGILDVNLLAPATLLSAALPHLGAGAAIVNISSVNAVLPPKGASVYGASKAAQDLWTRAMAKELGPQKIRVNGIAPGPTDTEATRTSVPAERLQGIVDALPLRRMGETQDIVNTVLFLCSDQASWVTGQTWSVDGGQAMRP